MIAVGVLFAWNLVAMITMVSDWEATVQLILDD
jgi:hypothetical protein